MALTVTKEYFFKNFDKGDNRYVGGDIDSSRARRFDFTHHREVLKEIEQLCGQSTHKMARLRNIVSVCFNILIENGIDISPIGNLQDLFRHFSFFIATTSEDEIYYECPCTQPKLYELDWFSVVGTENVFYVGSECVNKFNDENFQSDHKKKLKEQLTHVKIDTVLQRLRTDKPALIHFCRFNYPEICEPLQTQSTLTKAQLEKLDREIARNWQQFSKLQYSNIDTVGQYVRDRRQIFAAYENLVDENYKALFSKLVKKRKHTIRQLRALGMSGKNILKKTRDQQ